MISETVLRKEAQALRLRLGRHVNAKSRLWPVGVGEKVDETIFRWLREFTEKTLAAAGVETPAAIRPATRKW